MKSKTQHGPSEDLGTLCEGFPGPSFTWSQGSGLTAKNKEGEALQVDREAHEALEALAGHALFAQGRDSKPVSIIDVPSLNARFEAYATPLSRDLVVILARDLTLDTQIRDALTKSRSLYKDLADIAADFVWETDAKGAFSFISPKGALGRPALDWIGRKPDVFLSKASPAPRRSPFSPNQAMRNVELWMTSGEGDDRCVLVSGLPVTAEDGAITGARGLGLDVTEQRRAQSALAKALNREDLARRIVNLVRGQETPDAMLSTAAESICRAASAQGCDIFTVHDGVWRIAARFGEGGSQDGAYQAVESLPAGGAPAPILDHESTADARASYRGLGAVSLYRETPIGAIILWRRSAAPAWQRDAEALLPVIEGPLGLALRQIADQEALLAMARSDELTGLANRRAFMEELQTAVDRAARRPSGGALLYIDLDNFKPINDMLGHEAGDYVLVKVAAVLRNHCRAYDLAARLGGDEFALWLDEMDEEAAKQRAYEVRDAITGLNIDAPEPDKPFGLSVGVACLGAPIDIHTLLGEADAAMYRAKASGKNTVVTIRTATRPNSKDAEHGDEHGPVKDVGQEASLNT